MSVHSLNTQNTQQNKEQLSLVKHSVLNTDTDQEKMLVWPGPYGNTNKFLNEAYLSNRIENPF